MENFFTNLKSMLYKDIQNGKEKKATIIHCRKKIEEPDLKSMIYNKYIQNGKDCRKKIEEPNDYNDFNTHFTETEFNNTNEVYISQTDMASEHHGMDEGDMTLMACEHHGMNETTELYRTFMACDHHGMIKTTDNNQEFIPYEYVGMKHKDNELYITRMAVIHHGKLIFETPEQYGKVEENRNYDPYPTAYSTYNTYSSVNNKKHKDNKPYVTLMAVNHHGKLIFETPEQYGKVEENRNCDPYPTAYSTYNTYSSVNNK